LLGQGEGEHLDLGELVDAEESAGLTPVGPGLGAEAMAHAAELDGQLLGVEDLPGQHPAQRDLGRGHQAQIGPLDAVDLGLRAARKEADAFEDFVAGQVGRGGQGEPFVRQQAEGVALQGQLQQHRLVLQEVKPVARHPARRLEIHETELLADLHVVPRREVELGDGRSAPTDFGRLHADGGCRMRHVRDQAQQPIQLLDGPVQFPLRRGRLLAELAPLLLARFALGGVFGLADRLGHLVRPAIELVDFELARPAPLVQLSHAVQVDLDPAVRAVLFDRIKVFDDEFAVEHGS